MTIEELIALGGTQCKLCGGRMLKVDGCTFKHILCDGKLYERIKYGDESDSWVGIEDDCRCHDCGALPGHYHHINCDAEECPVCGGQLIGCDCDFEYVE